MVGLRRLLERAALLLALAGGQVAAEPVALGPEAMRQLAAEAIEAGQPELALPITAALLDRDAEDGAALLLRARALRDSGRYDEAADAARAAWGLSETGATRHLSALAMAQALASSQRRTRAQWWLRRAVHHAPTPEMRRRAIEDFRYVQARNPWSTEFSFSIAPRSNVNNGSARSATRLYDLPLDFRLDGSAQALSGTEVAGGANTRYRLSESRLHRTDLLLRAHYRTYRLSSEARSKAPNAKGSDFAFGSLAASFAHEARRDAESPPWWVAASAGQTWYGGDPYTRFLQLSGTQNWTLGSRTGANLSVTAEGQQGLGGTPDSRSLRVGAGVTRVLDGGSRLRLGLAATASRSDAASREFDRIEASARLSLARPVLSMDLNMGFTIAEDHFPQAVFGTGSRTDSEIALEITADLPAIEYHGFIPSLTLRAARTDSNLGLHDTEEVGLQLGWRSAF
ncbi:hypothetical protein DRV85_04135 [Rhodosalinus halophilus]|uniref:Tetratricopeptide repeat-containing protein n=1 Tax=Rhodosalinus halophilus TaxID=2259333 RepID=A0A365UC66_9RHOB|nr:hypothetical protein [Rhodosalinus halophilus]RBI86628.1 hypothetical protein DRV85_04135 [Rhodosalinus halophilus]